MNLGLSCVVTVTLPPAAACAFCPHVSDLAVGYDLPAGTVFSMWPASAATVCFVVSN